MPVVDFSFIPPKSLTTRLSLITALTCRQCVHEAWPGCIDKAWNITKEGTCVEGDSCVTWAVINTESKSVRPKSNRTKVDQRK